MDRTIKCRKCGGAHLTIKCGKNNDDQPNNQVDNKQDNNKEDNYKQDNYKEDNYKQNNYKEDNYKKNTYKQDNRTPYKTYKVRISNLPKDFEYDEISEFIKDWGNNPKVNIKNYDDSSIAIIEFKNSNEQDYFIEALDGTSFDHIILKVTKLD